MDLDGTKQKLSAHQIPVLGSPVLHKLLQSNFPQIDTLYDCTPLMNQSSFNHHTATSGRIRYVLYYNTPISVFCTLTRVSS